MLSKWVSDNKEAIIVVAILVIPGIIRCIYCLHTGVNYSWSLL